MLLYSSGCNCVAKMSLRTPSAQSALKNPHWPDDSGINVLKMVCRPNPLRPRVIRRIVSPCVELRVTSYCISHAAGDASPIIAHGCCSPVSGEWHTESINAAGIEAYISPTVEPG